MARSKAKQVVPSARACVRPRWFDGLSPRDLNHVLSLVDMGMDPARTSREEAVSCESFAANLVPCDSRQIHGCLLTNEGRASWSETQFAGSYSPQINTACAHEQSDVTAPLQRVRKVNRSKHINQSKHSKHSKQVPNHENFVHASKNQNQDTAANHNDLISTGIVYSWKDPCKLKHVAIQHTKYLITDFYQPSN
jgi:hypothetical protein